MAELDYLIQALQPKEERLAQDPFYGIGRGVASVDLQPKKWNPASQYSKIFKYYVDQGVKPDKADKLAKTDINNQPQDLIDYKDWKKTQLLKAAQGFTSNLFGGIGLDRADRAEANDLGLISRAVQSDSSGRQEMMKELESNNPRFKKALGLYDLAKTLQDEESQRSINKELKIEALKSYNKAQGDKYVKYPKGNLKLGGNGLLEYAAGGDSTAPQVFGAPQTQSSGIKTIDELTRDAAAQAPDLGISGGDTNEFIQNKLRNTYKRQEANTKEIDRNYEKLQNLKADLDKVSAAIDSAGATGSWQGGFQEFFDKNAPNILPGDPFGSDKREAARGDLAGQKVAAVQSNFTPGQGALSDKESSAIFQAGVSTDNTPQKNRAILNKIQKKADLQEDYLSFKNAWNSEIGDFRYMQDAWDNYKKLGQVFVPDGQGGVDINPNRKSWREFDFTQLVGANQRQPQATSSASDLLRQRRGQLVTAPDGRKFEIVD